MHPAEAFMPARSALCPRLSATLAIVTIAAAVGCFTGGVALAQPQWRLVEEVRFGDGSSEPYTFSDIRGIAVGAGGRMFVLDYKTQEIRAFGASGKCGSVALRPFARQRRSTSSMSAGGCSRS